MGAEERRAAAMKIDPPDRFQLQLSEIDPAKRHVQRNIVENDEHVARIRPPQGHGHARTAGIPNRDPRSIAKKVGHRTRRREILGTMDLTLADVVALARFLPVDCDRIRDRRRLLGDDRSLPAQGQRA
jgi:hypothetical protein